MVYIGYMYISKQDDMGIGYLNLWPWKSWKPISIRQIWGVPEADKGATYSASDYSQ
jgi:hypothetical protein